MGAVELFYGGSFIGQQCSSVKAGVVKHTAAMHENLTSTVFPLAAWRMSPGRMPRPSIMFSQDAVMMCTCSRSTFQCYGKQ